ncbi:peptidase propeptide and YPEB domain protein, partial [Enterococcus faecalis]
MIKRKEGSLMKKILYGSMTGLALFLVAGCTSKTPTAVSSTNEQKETVISTTETSSSEQQEATTTSEKTSAVAV